MKRSVAVGKEGETLCFGLGGKKRNHTMQGVVGPNGQKCDGSIFFFC